VRTLRGKRWLWWTSVMGVFAVIVGFAVWLVVRAGGDDERERRYRVEAACLLADADGIRGEEAAPVWEGMQRASLETRVQVSFLAVTGAQTISNATGYLGGLLQGHCDLLIAVGAAPVGAVVEVAAKYPGQRFAVVGDAASGNVTPVDGSSAAVYRLMSESLP
jgi:basic membrane lipoprotein Med (substrate-binding protein (PBP1-ABC) superfamily)